MCRIFKCVINLNTKTSHNIKIRKITTSTVSLCFSYFTIKSNPPQKRIITIHSNLWPLLQHLGSYEQYFFERSRTNSFCNCSHNSRAESTICNGTEEVHINLPFIWFDLQFFNLTNKWNKIKFDTNLFCFLVTARRFKRYNDEG